MPSIITNPDVFSLDPFIYIPSVLHGRRKQLQTLRKIHSNLEGGKRHYTLMVAHGPKSTGKTLTLRCFITENKESATIKYLHLKGSTSIMKAVKETKLPYFFGRVIPKTMQDCIDAMVEAARKEKPELKWLVLVLDDAQLYDIRNLSPMLRYIWEAYNQLLIPLPVINIPVKQFFARITQDTLSRYGFAVSGKAISFSHYGFQECLRILEQRAVEGLEHQSWDENIMKVIARHAVETADIRNGIEMLKLIAEQTPSGAKVSLEKLEQVKEKAAIRTTASDLKILPLFMRTYLLAITLAYLRFQSDRGVTLRQVETIHNQLCQLFDLSTPSKATIWRIRSTLKNDLDLIDTFQIAYRIPDARGRSRRGSTSFIKLKETPQTLLKALREAEWTELWDEATKKMQQLINKALRVGSSFC